MIKTKIIDYKCLSPLPIKHNSRRFNKMLHISILRLEAAVASLASPRLRHYAADSDTCSDSSYIRVCILKNHIVLILFML